MVQKAPLFQQHAPPTFVPLTVLQHSLDGRGWLLKSDRRVAMLATYQMRGEQRDLTNLAGIESGKRRSVLPIALIFRWFGQCR